MRDNEALKSSTTSFASSLCMGTPVQTDTQGTVISWSEVSEGFDTRETCSLTRSFVIVAFFLGHGKHHAHPTTERQESRDCLTGNTLQPEATVSTSTETFGNIL